MTDTQTLPGFEDVEAQAKAAAARKTAQEKTAALMDKVDSLTPAQSVLLTGQVFATMEQVSTAVATLAQRTGANPAVSATVNLIGALAVVGMKAAQQVRKAQGITSTGDDAVDEVMEAFKEATGQAPTEADKAKIAGLQERAKARAAKGEDFMAALLDEAQKANLGDEFEFIDGTTGERLDPRKVPAAKAEPTGTLHTGQYL